jgi:outer membrane immunogenic protein
MLYLRMLKFSVCCLAILGALNCKEAAAQAPDRTVLGSNSADASSWLAGVHAGYNWQQGTLVYGFESDLQATHLNSSMAGGLRYFAPSPPPPPDLASTLASVDWYGTFRGRVGATVGSLLLYLTAGVAYGDVTLSSTFSAFGLSTNGQTRQLKAGPVAGAGFEYLLMPNVMLTFGYQFVDLGSINVASSVSGSSGCCTSIDLRQSANAHAQFHTAMLGLSWRFAPASSSPWAGGYGGVHGGGAWGNDASAVYTGSSRSTFIFN